LKQLKEDSLKKRYLYKLGTKIIGIPFAIISAAIVPRVLGASAYGDFNFITDSFTKIITFFDSGTSAAFFTKITQRPKDFGLTRFYWTYFVIIIIIVAIILTSIFAFNIQESIWIGQKPLYICLGLVWAVLSWWNKIISKIIDAYGLSVQGELAVIKKSLFATCLLGLIFLLGKIDLSIFFIYHFLMFIFVGVLWWRVLKRNNITLFPQVQLTKIDIKNYSIEFYKFSMPIMVGGFFLLFIGFADRWLLQKYAGSEQQGLYSLALKISAISFLFTSALTPLFHREIAKAFGRNNNTEMRRLFLRFVPLLYSIAVIPGVYVFFQAEKISLIFGGESFKGAALPVAIMSLYPIHQSFGRLNSSIYFATGRTKLYRNIGVLNSLLGLIVAYLLLAPKGQWGLDLGAEGLALKMVFVQIIGQNVILWYNVKLLKISYFYMLRHQFLSVLIIGGAAGFSVLFANNVTESSILSIIVSVIIFSLFILIIIFFMPWLFSTTRVEIKDKFITVKKLINKSRRP
jgi:O-antigen/teichoic acid export membrane protein